MTQQCPACGAGNLIPKTEIREFQPPSVTEPIQVALHTSICDACGARVTTRVQRLANLAALASRKAAYGEWLTGEEILGLRKKYGLTQQQASEVFGKGKIAFSRYETETSYPDLTMTRLMRLAIGDASVMKSLADLARVNLPLLEKRLGTLAQGTPGQTRTGWSSQIVVEATAHFGAAIEDALATLESIPHLDWQSYSGQGANDQYFTVKAYK